LRRYNAELEALVTALRPLAVVGNTRPQPADAPSIDVAQLGRGVI